MANMGGLGSVEASHQQDRCGALMDTSSPAPTRVGEGLGGRWRSSNLGGTRGWGEGCPPGGRREEEIRWRE
jgi:hypothetical protein